MNWLIETMGERIGPLGGGKVTRSYRSTDGRFRLFQTYERRYEYISYSRTGYYWNVIDLWVHDASRSTHPVAGKYMPFFEGGFGSLRSAKDYCEELVAREEQGQRTNWMPDLEERKAHWKEGKKQLPYRAGG